MIFSLFFLVTFWSLQTVTATLGLLLPGPDSVSLVAEVVEDGEMIL